MKCLFKKNNYHFIYGEDDLSDVCLATLDEVDNLQNIYLVYSGDVEKKSKLQVEGTGLKTGPIKSMDWNATIYVICETNPLNDPEPSNQRQLGNDN